MRPEFANRICVLPHKTHPVIGLGVYALSGGADVIQIPKGGRFTCYEGRIQKHGKRVREEEEAYIFEVLEGYELVAHKWESDFDISKVDTAWVGARINNGCGEAENCAPVCLGSGAEQVIVFEATRDIYSGEELLWYYNDRYLYDNFCRKATAKDRRWEMIPGTDLVVTCLCPMHELDRAEKELADRRAKRQNEIKNRCGRRTKRRVGHVSVLEELGDKVEQLQQHFKHIRERCRKTKKQKIFYADLAAEADKSPEAQQATVPERNPKADVSTQTEQTYASSVSLEEGTSQRSDAYVSWLENAYLKLLAKKGSAPPKEIQGARALLELGPSNDEADQDAGGADDHVALDSLATLCGKVTDVGQDLKTVYDMYKGSRGYSYRGATISNVLLRLRDAGVVRLDISALGEKESGIPYSGELKIFRVTSENWIEVIARINDAMGAKPASTICENAAQYLRDAAIVPRRHARYGKCKWNDPCDGVWEYCAEAASKRMLRLGRQYWGPKHPKIDTANSP